MDTDAENKSNFEHLVSRRTSVLRKDIGSDNQLFNLNDSEYYGRSIKTNNLKSDTVSADGIQFLNGSVIMNVDKVAPQQESIESLRELVKKQFDDVPYFEF